VGLILLVPVVYAVARETNTPLLRVALPLMAGLSASQGFLPPHPGPMLAVEQMGADVGKTILYGTLIGVPTAVVAGPIFASIVGSKWQIELGGLGEQKQQMPSRQLPGFGLTLLTILLPVLLMLFSTLAGLVPGKDEPWRAWAKFIGSPTIAMLVAVLVSIYSFGYARGFDRKQISKFLEECLGPAAMILLVVGAGGGLSKMLERAGVGAAIADLVTQTKLSAFLLGWAVTAAIRVAVGSATVAITMASAIMSPVAASAPGINRELLVLAMGAGSLFFSHVNDGGFWFVKESFNLSVAQTFKTWTVLETCLGLVALGLIMLLSTFVR
jgi:GntP family gluconate:H+ symporter